MTAPFDPAAWLEAYQAVGGWFVVTPDDKISLGYFVYRRTEEEQDEARRLFREIEHIDERWMAIKDHVLACRVPT